MGWVFRVEAQRPNLTATQELLLDGADLDLVTIAFMVVDAQGRMHVWQDDDGRIRRFEPDGTELGPIGRDGEGPGEFRMRSFGGMVGDTFWVTDPMLRRTTFFAPDGKLLQTRRWPFGVTHGEEYYPAGLGVQPHIVEPRGTQIIRVSKQAVQPQPSWWPAGDVGSVGLRVDTAGRFIKLLWTTPPYVNACSQQLVVPGRSTGTIGIPFCQTAQRRESFEADRIIEVTPDSSAPGKFAIRATRLDGSPLYALAFSQRRVRIPREVADSARREQMQPRLGPFPDIDRARAAAYGRMEFPGFYPSVTDLFIGRDGSAWVALRRASRERQWMLYAPDGTARGTVALPPSFRMYHAEANRIWGTIRDDDDLPSVVRYRVP